MDVIEKIDTRRILRDVEHRLYPVSKGPWDMMQAWHEDTVAYSSKRIHRHAPGAEFRAQYRPIAPVTYAAPGTLEHWFTERYYLYTVVGRAGYQARDFNSGGATGGAGLSYAF